MRSLREISGHLIERITGICPIKWVNVATTSVGDNTVVAGVSGKKIRVISITLKAAVALTLSVKSGNNIKIEATVLAANERLDFNAHPGFWVETNVSEALIFNHALAGMQGILNYIEIN